MRTSLCLLLVLPALALAADDDYDGLDDAVEAANGIDPLLPDSDGDSLLDGEEWDGTGYPPDFDFDTVIDPLDTDDDDDGAPTWAEVALIGKYPTYDGMPLHLLIDVDDDLRLDGEEWLNWLDADANLPTCVDYNGAYKDPALYSANRPFFDVNTGAWSCAFDGFVAADQVADAAWDAGAGAYVTCATATGGGYADPWDRDCDGLPNALDPDDDGDGIPTIDEGDNDNHEVCWPFGGSAAQPGDGIPSFLDRDGDGDGLADAAEALGDADQDGLDDLFDCRDLDPAEDADEDGVKNGDEDALCDVYQVDCAFLTDSDGDHVLDGEEYLAGQTDGDGIPDVLDPDDDDDGVPTIDEAVAYCADDTQTPVIDIIGTQMAWWCDYTAPGTLALWPNHDAPGSGAATPDLLPDYLDEDDNGDGQPTSKEDANENGDLNDDDADGDSVPDWLDPVVDVEDTGEPDTDTTPGPLDTDGDGIPDSVEGTNDADGDGIPNHEDLDSDGDGASDEAEGDGDPDGNGIPAFLDDGADGDGDAPPDKAYGCGCQSGAGPASAIGALLGALVLRRRRR